jgi:hypothetical protein
MFNVFSNKATASYSRVGVDVSDMHSGRVISKNSEYLSQYVKKRVIVFGVSFSSPNWRVTGR